MDGFPILRLTAVFWLQVLLIGCGNGREVAEAVAGLPPLGSLRGVHLDMNPSELRAVRPAAQQLEENLYGENLEGYRIHYLFTLPFPILDKADLLEVRAWNEFDLETEARIAWGAWATRVQDLLGEPTECRRSRSRSVESEHAIWRSGATEVAVSFARGRERDSNDVAVPRQVSLRVKYADEGGGPNVISRSPCDFTG